MALNISQFAMSTVQGAIDLTVGVRSVLSAQIGSGSAGGLVAGQAVKLVNSAGGIPDVVECAADTDDVFGFIAYSIKDQAFAALDKAEIAFGRGAVMYMTASAAIAPGDKVMIVVASKKVAIATSGKTIVGRALDKAAADGDLIRVMIDLPGTAAA
jgi:hypothetical protein